MRLQGLFPSALNGIRCTHNELSMNHSRQTFPIFFPGWRNEYYEVLTASNSAAVMKMDRSATCLFGIRNFGVEINGYIQCPTRGICVWLQQRRWKFIINTILMWRLFDQQIFHSATKQTWPNKWDNMVSGGLSVGHGVKETAIKEAAEEASIPKVNYANFDCSF